MSENSDIIQFALRKAPWLKSKYEKQKKLSGNVTLYLFFSYVIEEELKELITFKEEYYIVLDEEKVNVIFEIVETFLSKCNADHVDVVATTLFEDMSIEFESGVFDSYMRAITKKLYEFE